MCCHDNSSAPYTFSLPLLKSPALYDCNDIFNGIFNGPLKSPAARLQPHLQQSEHRAWSLFFRQDALGCAVSVVAEFPQETRVESRVKTRVESRVSSGNTRRESQVRYPVCFRTPFLFLPHTPFAALPYRTLSRSLVPSTTPCTTVLPLTFCSNCPWF